MLSITEGSTVVAKMGETQQDSYVLQSFGGERV